jgi:alpha-glucosidase
LEGKYRQDPTWFRTKGKRVGRDGCRVPLPWESGVNESNGFSPNGESWLPQPDSFQRLARNAQSGVAGSTLELYKRALKIRKELGLGAGDFAWATDLENENSLAYVNRGIAVIANFGSDPIVLPQGEVLVTSQTDLSAEGYLETDQTAWIRLS